jgi:hypothetical protein
MLPHVVVIMPVPAATGDGVVLSMVCTNKEARQLLALVPGGL